MINFQGTFFMLLFMIEVLVIEALFCHSLQRKNSFWKRYVSGVLIVAVYSAVIPLVGDIVFGWIFSQISIFMLSVFLMAFCYEEPFINLMFLGVVSYTIQHISSVLFSFISMINPEQFQHIKGIGHAPSVLITIFLCDLLVYSLCYWFIIKKMRGVEQLRFAGSAIFALTGTIMIVNQVVGVLFEFYSGAGPQGWTRGSHYFWNLICCFLCLSLQMGIFGKGKAEMELDIMRHLSAEKEKQYQLSKSTTDAINMKCHNLKYQLSRLSIDKNSEQALQETYELIDTFDSEIKTGNEILDLIFTEKNLHCKLHNISFVCMIDGSKLDFMEVADIYNLFGNLIDNAIQAVNEVQENARRSIYIHVSVENKLLHISTENCFEGEIKFLRGLPVTRTGDFLNHGYGMKSIRLICEKYGGNVSASARNQVFYLDIVIPVS